MGLSVRFVLVFVAEVLGAPILLDIDNSSQFVSSNAPLDKVNLHQAEITSTTRKLNLNFSSIDAENSTTPTLAVNAKDIGYNVTGTGQQYQIDNSFMVYSAIETKDLALAEIDEEIVDVEALKAKIQ